MTAGRHLLAVVTEPLVGPESIDELRRRLGGEPAKVRIVLPVVEETLFRHTLGDCDEPAREARARLEASLTALRSSGVAIAGEVGDPDPVLAAEEALREAPADEVLIFEHAEDRARWFEHGLFERAREQIDPSPRLILVHDDGHAVGVEDDAVGVASRSRVGVGAGPPRS